MFCFGQNFLFLISFRRLSTICQFFAEPPILTIFKATLVNLNRIAIMYGLNGHKYGQYWCLCEEQEKCRYPVKAELKNVHQFKSYGQNKIFCEKVAKNEQFTLYFWPKLKMGGRSHGCEKNSFLFDILSVKVLSEPHAR